MSDTTVLWQFVGEAITFIFICYVMIGIGKALTENHGPSIGEIIRRERRRPIEEANQRFAEAKRQAQKERRQRAAFWLGRTVRRLTCR